MGGYAGRKGPCALARIDCRCVGGIYNMGPLHSVCSPRPGKSSLKHRRGVKSLRGLGDTGVAVLLRMAIGAGKAWPIRLGAFTTAPEKWLETARCPWAARGVAWPRRVALRYGSFRRQHLDARRAFTEIG